jgi:hypothetical protein
VLLLSVEVAVLAAAAAINCSASSDSCNVRSIILSSTSIICVLREWLHCGSSEVSLRCCTGRPSVVHVLMSAVIVSLLGYMCM